MERKITNALIAGALIIAMAFAVQIGRAHD